MTDGYEFEVVNAGVSGDTSAGGLRRLDWALAGDVRVLIVALGANDGLRGLSVAEMKHNLAQIIAARAGEERRGDPRRHGGAAELRAGVRAVVPPGVSAIWPRSSRVLFIPFLLDKVAGQAGAEPGRRHPSEREGAAIVADTVWSVLQADARSDGGRFMIELRGVSKTVPSGTRHAHDSASAGSRRSTRGRVVAITGPSGSGKSTLLGLIAGLDAPSTGQILIDGVDITALDEDALARLRGKRIGFVFQFFHLLPSLTALENVLVPMEIAGVPTRRPRAPTRCSTRSGLADRGHHYPSQLSGGEQQRVAIARALANDPPLLLADEPTGNLDSATGHQVIDLLLGVNRSRGTTLVLVTHDPELAGVADVTVALRDGRVVRDQPRREAVGLDECSSCAWRCASCGRRGGGCCSSSSAWRSASARSSRCARSSRACAAA